MAQKFDILNTLEIYDPGFNEAAPVMAQKCCNC